MTFLWIGYAVTWVAVLAYAWRLERRVDRAESLRDAVVRGAGPAGEARPPGDRAPAGPDGSAGAGAGHGDRAT